MSQWKLCVQLVPILTGWLPVFSNFFATCKNNTISLPISSAKQYIPLEKLYLVYYFARLVLQQQHTHYNPTSVSGERSMTLPHKRLERLFLVDPRLKRDVFLTQIARKYDNIEQDTWQMKQYYSKNLSILIPTLLLIHLIILHPTNVFTS